MAIRKGSKVRYIGDNELGKGKVFTVHKKSYNHILVNFPIKYIDGSVHAQASYYPISDFKEVK